MSRGRRWQREGEEGDEREAKRRRWVALLLGVCGDALYDGCGSTSRQHLDRVRISSRHLTELPRYEWLDNLVSRVCQHVA